MMKHRIKDTASSLMKSAINSDTKGGWKMRLSDLEKTINLNEAEYRKPKRTLKNEVNQRIKKSFQNKIEKDAEEKSKVQHLINGQQKWEVGNMKEYMYKMPRKVASRVPTYFPSKDYRIIGHFCKKL